VNIAQEVLNVSGVEEDFAEEGEVFTEEGDSAEEGEVSIVGDGMGDGAPRIIMEDGITNIHGLIITIQ
jgi:hypothetical protein